MYQGRKEESELLIKSPRAPVFGFKMQLTRKEVEEEIVSHRARNLREMKPPVLRLGRISCV